MATSINATITMAKFWLETLCHEFDVDLAETNVTVNVKSDTGRKELGRQNLGAFLAELDGAIETTKGDAAPVALEVFGVKAPT